MNLFQRINEVHKKVKSVFKNTEVQITASRSYSAVSHDDVTALLHDPLANNGIVAFPSMVSCELEEFSTEREYQGKVTVSNSYRVKVWASVTYINIDDPTDRITTQCFAYALDSGDKATGKAYSMAIKYCHLKTFMLESLDEEESREFEQQPRQQRQQEKPVFNLDNAPKGDVLASPKQKELLNSWGVTFKDTLTMKEASALIAERNKK